MPGTTERSASTVAAAGPAPSDSFDLIVIGAGINGAGIARDAAARGLRVALVEREDIGSGTSNWSGRLIHGGLRYLEQGDVRLVRESLRERERLFSLAPHLVKPVPVMMPFYGYNKRPKWTVRVGMARLRRAVLGQVDRIAHGAVARSDAEAQPGHQSGPLGTALRSSWTAR